MFNNTAEIKRLRDRVDKLEFEVMEMRKSTCVPLAGPSVDGFYAVEFYKGADIKRKFEQLYKFLGVKIEPSAERLVKDPNSKTT